MSGYIELKPSQDPSDPLFQLLGFTFPQPTGRGNYKQYIFYTIVYYIFKKLIIYLRSKCTKCICVQCSSNYIYSIGF